PDQSRKSCGGAVENRDEGGETERGEGERPGKEIRLNEKRVPDPPETSKEISKAEKPADQEWKCEAAQDRVPRNCSGTVQEPDQDWEGDEARGREIVGWLPKGAKAASRKCEQRSAPSG